MRDAVFTTLFIVTSVYAIKRPWLGVLIWTCLDDMNPHRLCYSYANYSIPFSLIAACITLISILISKERHRIAWSREGAVLILFMLWMTFTSFFALNTDEVWVEWNRAMKSQLLILVTLLVMDKREKVHMLTWVIAVSIGFWAVKGGIFTLLTGGGGLVRGPSDSFIEDNNDIALAIVTVIPLMRYLQLAAEKRWVRLGLSGAIALSTLAVVATYSRAGLLALMTVAILLLIKSRHKLVFGAFLIGSIVAILLFVPQKWFDRMHTLETVGDAQARDGSIQGRLNAWAFAWNLAQSRPIIGGGYRCFTPELFLQYAPDPDDYHAAHSIFLKIMAEHGFPGLFVFLTLAVFTWKSAGRTRRVAAANDMMWAADLSAMLQVALAGYAVGGAFSNLTYFGLPYQLMAIVVLVKNIVREETSEQNELPSEMHIATQIRGQEPAYGGL